MVANFVNSLYKMYVDLYFTYLEINPLVVTDNTIYILDLAAKIDATADFVCRKLWGDIFYPPPFGRDAYPEEAYIADLDSKSGASLKVRISSSISDAKYQQNEITEIFSPYFVLAHNFK